MLCSHILCFVDENSCTGGFEEVQKQFPPGASAWISLDCDKPPFDSQDLTIDAMVAVHEFGRFERALDKLPRPTLVTCGTGQRASAVVTAYLAIKERMSVEAARKFGVDRGKV